MYEQHNNHLLSALIVKDDDKTFRYVLYKRVIEDILDRIFQAKNDGLEQWYYIHNIPVKCESDIEEYQYYSQTECCEYVAKDLEKKGFYVKTMQHKTSVFISWHADHLTKVQRKVERHKSTKSSKLSDAKVDDEWKHTTTKATIQLSGGKANLQSNRQKLANFFISRSS